MRQTQSFLMGRLCSLLLVLLHFGYCLAGPVREGIVEETKLDGDVCEVKNVTFARGDVVPDVAPCETCVCAPPEVKCSPVKCQPNNGCKIIQQSGKCCPEYKCDCEHEGKTYNNGEKLHNPTSPCQVCYCRGGDIMCNSITCYRRDDCEPQHVEGQCCPKYGHCPPKNSSSVIADPSGLSTKREMQPWLLTKSVNLQTTETPSKYPQTINIVEILPTQAPARSGEVSLVPRIITNGGPDRVTPAEASTSSYSNPSSTEASEVAQPLKMSPGPENGESAQPDSETYTTLLPQMMDVTAAYEELSDLTSGATEGTGYDLESGGTFFPNTTKDNSSEEQEGSGDSSEEEGTTTTIAVPLEPENPKGDVDEAFDTANNTMSANLLMETTHSNLDGTSNVTAEDPEPTTDLPGSSSDASSKTDGLITRHGLTIPPILNLNHQLHHLTLGGTGEEVEDKSVVRIGVYNPTMPGEVSSMVTVMKNEDMSNSATTQVLLTPQDLKTLAEMIIKEKIKAPNEKLEMGTTPLPTELYDETTVASPESAVADNATTMSQVEGTTPMYDVSSSKSLSKEEQMAQAVLDKLTSNVHAPLQGIELVDANNTATEGEVEETTPRSEVGSENSLTKEEQKAQAELKKAVPQGSVLIDGNDTTTSEPVEVLPSNNTEILSNKEAEWVEVSNSTKNEAKVNVADKIEDVTTEAASDSTESSSEETSSELDSSTVVSTSTSTFPDISSESGKSRGSLRQMEDLVSQLPDVTDRRTRITTNDQSKHISMAMFDEKDQMLVENFFKKALDFQ